MSRWQTTVYLAETDYRRLQMLALVDVDDRHHRALRKLFEHDPDVWVLPWVILPEIDYLLAAQMGQRVAELFMLNLAAGAFKIERGQDNDLRRAQQISARYRALRLGLVDSSVIAVAERLGAGAIATLDLRHFGAVIIKGQPKLFPRDL